jgi:hypothetical protein
MVFYVSFFLTQAEVDEGEGKSRDVTAPRQLPQNTAAVHSCLMAAVTQMSAT